MFMGILEGVFHPRACEHWTVNVLCAPKDITGAASPSFQHGEYLGHCFGIGFEWVDHSLLFGKTHFVILA